MSLQVAVTEGTEGDRRGRCDAAVFGKNHLTILPDELDAGRELDQPLAEAHEQVINLGSLRRPIVKIRCFRWYSKKTRKLPFRF
ncbi:hypothetical protein Sinac_2064 [Singulisphaera acidiphila DSM 18658]|uniref:Uncharacterized protein n=1 Tax=Singulisphaera acidiphila (strain ATCC BAA-1392 / DSM 18658 / VKM B-2454 / MOB10) TaxID=886293 RepID=L0DCP1_SINAD|nr:hypothetical protein Sinac_2064 [Singulisphaera acidiphila DSM 18658]